MQKVNIGIIGTGWCGGIRAETCAASPYVSELHIAEIKEARLKEVAEKTKPVTATTDYRALLKNDNINAIIVSATPETVHYPMAKETLLAGKHLLLEKPISLTLAEADELIDLARSKSLLFTIGYSQRFNPKFAYVKRSIADGTIGQPVSALVSRHITRNLGNKIGGRIKLSPAAMEATHDIDFVLWCFEPRKPVRVYAQLVNKIMQPTHGVPGLRLDHRDAGRRQRFHDRRRLGASSGVSEFFVHVDRDGRQRRRDHGGRFAPRRQHQHDEARHRIPALHHARRKSGARLCRARWRPRPSTFWIAWRAASSRSSLPSTLAWSCRSIRPRTNRPRKIGPSTSSGPETERSSGEKEIVGVRANAPARAQE